MCNHPKFFFWLKLRVAEAAVAAIEVVSGDEWEAGTACDIMCKYRNFLTKAWKPKLYKHNRSTNLLHVYVSTLDDASGITIDYIHGEASVPYSFIPELRSMGDHDNSTIEPSFQENWAALVATINEIEEIASETQ